MKTVRKGGFHFAVGLRESKFIPLAGEIPSGPPNRYWTNTYFFSGGFAVKCSL